MNAAASSSGELILWFGTFLAVLILAFFYLDSFSFFSRPFEMVSQDVDGIVSLSNEACSVFEFSALYNPVVEEGIFFVDDKNVCIISDEIQLCKNTLCSFVEKKEFNLKKVKFLNILKEKNSEGINVEAENI